MKIDFKVKGDKELLAKLKALGGDVDKAVLEGLMNGAKTVQGLAKQLCPVDTGALKNSIVTQKEEATAVSVSTNLEYAAYVEFGTGRKGDPSVHHTAKEKWVYRNDKGEFFTTSGQKPQPFLGPALNQNKDEIKRQLDLAVKQAIRERSGGT